MSRPRIALLLALGVPLVVFGLIAAAWAIDSAGHSDTAVRGVVVAGHDIGGTTRTGVRSTVDELASTVEHLPIAIAAGEGTNGFHIDTTASELGLSVDVDATVNAAMDVGRTDSGPAAPVRWLKSLFVDRQLPLRLALDRGKVVSAVGRLEGDRHTEPVEPMLNPTEKGITVVPGKSGVAIDVDHLAAALPSTLNSTSGAIKVTAPRIETRPKVPDSTIQALADTANATTRGKVTLTFGTGRAGIDGPLFRPAFRVVTDASGARLDLDPDMVGQLLTSAKVAPFNPTGVTFDLANGQMVAKGGSDAVVCCGPKAASQIAAGLLGGSTTIAVDPVTVSAADGLAAAGALGIKEVVGEFTTKHAAGQPRVKNIHRISDLTRGVLISPGQTWSVNEFVGRRTVEKGFVTAPVIDKGEFSEDVGGGVSQYATTLFNAAFFAGLDIPEHKAHSIYISRYPFGREATLAYPSVDLKVTNNTPYGVVIWPTYTDTSITVQLWSTRFATGTQQSVTPPSGCGKITVVRARSFTDGRSDSQKYTANYDCTPPTHH